MRVASSTSWLVGAPVGSLGGLERFLNGFGNMLLILLITVPMFVRSSRDDGISDVRGCGVSLGGRELVDKGYVRKLAGKTRLACGRGVLCALDSSITARWIWLEGESLVDRCEKRKHGIERHHVPEAIIDGNR